MGVEVRPAVDARTIDREHQVQVRLMLAVEAQLSAGEDGADEIEALVDYSRAHFLSEELLMRQYEYADYDDHVQDHERMLDWLAELVDGNAEAAARLRALIELKSLFLRHIAGRDSQLHDFLRSL